MPHGFSPAASREALGLGARSGPRPTTYVGKLLFIRAGEALSLQYHEVKDESWLVHEGRARLELGSVGDELEVVEIGPGDALHFPPGTVHRVSALEDTLDRRGLDATPGRRRPPRRPLRQRGHVGPLKRRLSPVWLTSRRVVSLAVHRHRRHDERDARDFDPASGAGSGPRCRRRSRSPAAATPGASTSPGAGEPSRAGRRRTGRPTTRRRRRCRRRARRDRAAPAQRSSRRAASRTTAATSIAAARPSMPPDPRSSREAVGEHDVEREQRGVGEGEREADRLALELDVGQEVDAERRPARAPTAFRASARRARPAG